MRFCTTWGPHPPGVLGTAALAEPTKQGTSAATAVGGKTYPLPGYAPQDSTYGQLSLPGLCVGFTMPGARVWPPLDSVEAIGQKWDLAQPFPDVR